MKIDALNHGTETCATLLKHPSDMGEEVTAALMCDAALIHIEVLRILPNGRAGWAYHFHGYTCVFYEIFSFIF